MPRTVHPDDRHRDIHRAVLEIAVENGYRAVTVRGVAQRLDASTSVVTHYFSRREELISSALRAVLDRLREELHAVIADGGPTGDPAGAAASIRRFVDRAVFGSPPDLRRAWMRAVMDAPGDQVVRAELARFDADWDDMLASLVARLASHPDRRSELTSRVDLIVSGAVVAGMEGSTEEEVQRTVRALVDLVLTEAPVPKP